MTTGAGTAAVLPLLVWLSPNYPVGAFAYSHGLEAAVDAGLVGNAAALEAWIAALVSHGSGRQDLILAARAWRAADARDADALADLNDLALALAPSRERRLETGATGRAFTEATRAAWPSALAVLPADRDIAYPVAFGAAAGTAGLSLADSLAALALAFAGNLVSAALRLGIVGQTDGQRVLAASVVLAEASGWSAAAASLDDLGGFALRSDIAAIHHETLYSRLFRS